MDGRQDAYRRYVSHIEGRHDRDLIINIAPVLLAVALPLLLSLFLLFITGTDIPAFSKFVFLGEASPRSMVFVPLLVEPLILGAVIYRLHWRLEMHAKRDSEERRILIDYAEAVKADTAEMERLHEEADSMSRFPRKNLSSLVLLVMNIYVVLCFLYFLPSAGSIQGMNEAIILLLYVFVLIILASVFATVLRYPHLHDYNQAEFTIRFADALAEKNITVGTMAPSIKHRSTLVSVLLTVVTLGLYLLVVLYNVFRDTNAHMKCQWAYEDGLMDGLSSGGSSGPVKGTVKDAKRMNKTPLTMRFAELFLIAIMATYILDLVGTAADIEAFPDAYNIALIGQVMSSLPADEKLKQLMTYGMVVWNVFFITFTLDAVMAIGSRRSTAWRRVVQNCLTFTVPTWISYYLYSVDSYTHLFDLDPYLTTAILYVLLLFMFVSKPVKAFYTPSTIEVPKTGRWLRFAVYGSLKDEEPEEEVPDEVPEEAMLPEEDPGEVQSESSEEEEERTA